MSTRGCRKSGWVVGPETETRRLVRCWRWHKGRQGAEVTAATYQLQY